MPPRDSSHWHFQSDHGERRKLMSDTLIQQPSGFWAAVKFRRECSNRQAATDAAALARRQRYKWRAIAYGQVIALIAASVNVSSFALENDYNVVTPTFLLFVMYIFLSIHLYFRTQHHETTDTIYYLPIIRIRLKIPWYLYFLISCIDVGAGVIMLRALQYTSLPSVTLLASLTIPSTMVFSKLFLDNAFRPHHFFGVFLCLIGGCITIWSDLESGDSPSIKSLQTMNIGDLMAISAALLYGLGDAVAEYSVKHIDRMELLGMLGLFGAILTGLQFPFREYGTLSSLFSDLGSSRNAQALMLMISYVALLLLYYVTEASFLVSSDATLLNLSLQTQNLWAILFSVLSHESAPSFLFYIAVALVGTGVFAYEVGPTSDRLVLAIEDSAWTVADGTELEEFEGIVNEEGPQAYDAQKHQQSLDRMKYSSIQQIEIV